jgi:peptide/nickel transport system permease protein
VLIIGAAVLAPWLAPTDPYDNDLMAIDAAAGQRGLPLGTDGQGRDMLTRLLYGLRVTLLMGRGGGTRRVLGALLGFLAAFYRAGWTGRSCG